MKYFILLVLFTGCALKEKAPREVASISVANLNGQKWLYENGWLFIPSAEKSLTYSYLHSIQLTSDSFTKWKSEVVRDGQKFANDMAEIPQNSKEIYQSAHDLGKKGRDHLKQITHEYIKVKKKVAQKSFSKAYENLKLGSVQITELTKDEVHEIKKKVFGLGTDIKKDLKTMKQVTSFLKNEKTGKADKTWKAASRRAVSEWQNEYEKSAEQPNSLLALPYVVWGSLKSLWYGLFSPSIDYTIDGSQFVGNQSLQIFKKGVLLPLGGTVVIAGRTLWNTGAILFYAGKMGGEVASQYLQAGWFTSQGALSAASIVPTYIFGNSIGYLHEIGMQGAGLVGGAGYALGDSVFVAGNYTASLFNHTLNGVGKIVYGGAKAVAVLGYNGLTALPAQVFLSTINTVWFLAWDGPRLALYSIQGKLKEGEYGP